MLFRSDHFPSEFAVSFAKSTPAACITVLQQSGEPPNVDSLLDMHYALHILGGATMSRGYVCVSERHYVALVIHALVCVCGTPVS